MNTSPQKSASTLAQIIQTIHMTIRLLRSPKVPIWTKVIPVLAVAYLIFPLDFIPDFIPGLGQLDDLTLLLIALWAFLQLCPPAVVREMSGEPDVVDANYRVIKDEKPAPSATDELPPAGRPQQ